MNAVLISYKIQPLPYNTNPKHVLDAMENKLLTRVWNILVIAVRTICKRAYDICLYTDCVIYIFNQNIGTPFSIDEKYQSILISSIFVCFILWS